MTRNDKRNLLLAHDALTLSRDAIRTLGEAVSELVEALQNSLDRSSLLLELLQEASEIIENRAELRSDDFYAPTARKIRDFLTDQNVSDSVEP